MNFRSRLGAFTSDAETKRSARVTAEDTAKVKLSPVLLRYYCFESSCENLMPSTTPPPRKPLTPHGGIPDGVTQSDSTLPWRFAVVQQISKHATNTLLSRVDCARIFVRNQRKTVYMLGNKSVFASIYRSCLLYTSRCV